ncbi:tyrosine-protein phosphatase [Erysipelothrix urinaevulpis]|uniref:tyrosine-protein phosphatase n=1 Tax=Erysipelothrix urinaevulpis TaxID=2683717 RepID=UPI00135C5C25|nr:tyrosine-protein phosphatase [Erysipelothrix urinaevulpis]
MITITELESSVKFNIEEDALIKVYVGSLPTASLDDKHYLGTISKDNNELEKLHDTTRNYYVLVFKDGQKQLVANRYINLDGTHNLRDYGGYPTKDGKHVKWGVLFRGDQLSDLSDDDIERLVDMELRTIVDFRSDLEARNFPNKLIPNTKTYSLDPNATTAQLAAGSVDVQEKKNMSTIDLLKAGTFDPSIYGNPEENMLHEYKKFSTSKEAIEAYQSYISLFLKDDTLPLLQHCRGGKDRTGFGVAILQLILGVDEENIIHDYELSTYYKSERNKRQMNRYRQYTDDEEILELLHTMQLSKGIYMEAALKQIKEIYGSYDNYFKEALALSDEDLNAIRQRLTE